jgi:hypothetical protein
MRWMFRAGVVLLAGTILAVCGCAGAKKPVSQSMPEATAVVVTLALQGAVPPGETINTVDLTLNLPPGVTAKSAPSGLTAEGVMIPSGAAQGALAATRFIPAAGTQPAQLRMALIRAVGFGPGEIATLHLDLSGHELQPGEFSIVGLHVTDSRGETLRGISATIGLPVE